MKASQLKGLLVQLCLVSGLLFCVSFSAQAQATSKIGVSSVEKVEYCSADEAVQRLNTAMDDLKAQLDGLNQGSQQYKSIEGRYMYYRSIANILSSEKAESSEDVANAILRSFGIYASDAYGTIPDNQREQNKDAAVDLLRL